MQPDQLLAHNRVIPVVVIESESHAVPLARSLLDGGISIIEVTLRSQAALAAIAQIRADLPEMLVGAGSVRHPDQISAVQQAGAQFAVSPGHSECLLRACEKIHMPLIPGAITPSEMLFLYQRGYPIQKFFPAELAGGTAMLRAVSAPLPEISFIPTGGISANRAKEYLALDNVLAIGGSWLAPPALLAQNAFAQITELAKNASNL